MGLFKYIAKKIGLDTKQDVLQSGVNIKTINNQSILGEGNLQIGDISSGSISIDSELNISSSNPVANAAVTSELRKQSDEIEKIRAEVKQLIDYLHTTAPEKYDACMELIQKQDALISELNRKMDTMAASIANEFEMLSKNK
jgi:hypothetical protein